MKPLSPKTDASPSRLQAMLDRLAQKNAAKRAKANESSEATPTDALKNEAQKGAPNETKSQKTEPNVEDVFGSAPTGHTALGTKAPAFRPGETSGRSSGGGMLGARVAALSGDLSATGRVFHGDLKISTAADLVGLNGIRAITGELIIAESDLDSAALAPLRQVEEVGSLALEGNSALTALDALSGLKTVEDRVYVGFNPNLQTIDLPGLTTVGGAMVIEGNPSLTSASLKALSNIGRYFHASENEALVAIDLTSLGGLDELVLQDNPKLSEFRATQMKAPADVEVVGSKELTLAEGWAS